MSTDTSHIIELETICLPGARNPLIFCCGKQVERIYCPDRRVPCLQFRCSVCDVVRHSVAVQTYYDFISR